MRSASTPLINYLNAGRVFRMADLYTFALVGGTVLRYTDADIDLAYQGDTFSRFLISRTKTKASIGVEVDEVTVTVSASTSDLINGMPWMAAVSSGALDGALITVQRIFMPTWGDTSLGALMMFGGRTSDVNIGRSEAQISIKSELELFNTELPRDLYQSGCLNTLYDNGCTVNKASAAVTGTVISTTGSTITTSLGNPSGYFALGSIRFDSGANINASRSVRAFNAGIFTLSAEFDTLPSPGDAFTAWPGCDKVMATCDTKFSNLDNFRGYPFVPDPETAT
jgi:uncharacterized phage protein (TIGR02218 family)